MHKRAKPARNNLVWQTVFDFFLKRESQTDGNGTHKMETIILFQP